jgi:hypothetical protein
MKSKRIRWILRRKHPLQSQILTGIHVPQTCRSIWFLKINEMSISDEMYSRPNCAPIPIISGCAPLSNSFNSGPYANSAAIWRFQAISNCGSLPPNAPGYSDMEAVLTPLPANCLVKSACKTTNGSRLGLAPLTLSIPMIHSQDRRLRSCEISM